MPERYNEAEPTQPTHQQELISYLEAALQLTEKNDATAGFLLRLTLNVLKARQGGSPKLVVGIPAPDRQ
jgi:hypothetical protein